jgi:ATP-dependent protease ClpP protease subunit
MAKNKKNIPKSFDEEVMNTSVTDDTQCVYDLDPTQDVEVELQLPMTKSVFIYKKDIDTDSAQEFFNWVEHLDGRPGELILETAGGHAGMAQAITIVLYENPNITVSIANYTASAGARIFLSCVENNRMVYPATRCIIVHKVGVHGNLAQVEYKGSDENINSKQIKRMFKEQIEFYSDILTKKEMKKFKKGYDVILPYERILEILGV